MLLQQIGARLILFGIVFGVIAINIVRRFGPDTWFHKFWPLIMFLFIAVGAMMGVAGMIRSAIQRRRRNSN